MCGGDEDRGGGDHSIRNIDHGDCEDDDEEDAVMNVGHE